MAKAQGITATEYAEKALRNFLADGHDSDAIARLADQLDKNPATFAAEVLQAGIQALDDGLGSSSEFTRDRLFFMAGATTHKVDHRYTISGIIQRMDAGELAEFQNEADDRNENLQVLIRERYSRGVNMETLQ